MTSHPWRRHPSFELLSRYHDDVLESPVVEAVERHIATCERCQAYLTDIQNMDRALCECLAPSMPPDALVQALARRRDRSSFEVIHASRLDRRGHQPGPMPRLRSRYAVAAAAGALVTLALVALLATANRASGDLTTVESVWRDDASGRGWELRVRPSSRLRGEDSLRIRAWGWQGDIYVDQQLPHLVETTLEATGHDFVGWFPLEDDRLDFFRFAVETVRGDRIDTNGGTYWSLPDEREPRSVRSYVAQSISLTALQRSRGIINSDAYDSLLAKGLREHPGHPLLMRLGAVHDVWFITTEEARDSARAFHLEHLEAYASHQPRTVEELGALTNYATALVDDFWADPTVERLRRELERVAPDHPEVSRLRLVSTWMSVEGDRQSLAGFFEEEWDRLSPGYVGDLPELANIALEGSADLALRRRWAERRFLLRRATRDGWLLQDVRDPGLRDWAMRHIPDRIRFWEQPDDSLRPLHQTREDYEKSSRRLAARLMIGLGYGHVARRELDEAIALLEPALNIHWDLSAAEALLENAGEVGYDLPRIRALVEADPLSTLSARMELSDPNARAELLRLLKAQVPTTRAAPSRIRVRQAIDVDVSLNTGTTLIAYWYSPPVDEASLSYLERLRDAGVATWLLSREQNYEVTRGIADRVGGEAAFQVDSYGREVFGIRRIEAYVVVHGGRFWTTFRAEEAVRLALLLTDGERP